MMVHGTFGVFVRRPMYDPVLPAPYRKCAPATHGRSFASSVYDRHGHNVHLIGNSVKKHGKRQWGYGGP
ncbi:MAG: hypothetical protein JW768_07890 [Chitinispirillaceae bacterium]|nr:hypothetical protein [Chitinispirillaceae bacterium]